jgi:4-diphosphocytidyl-2-C-methyl-D-erythritol kinase
MSVRVFAPAKINLTLKVGRPRADGMHPLQSAVMFADVGDWIEVRPSEQSSLRITGPFADALQAEQGDNIVWKAMAMLQREAGVSGGADIVLEKNLPVASGIGGGSSDAAAALKALNAVWRLGMSDRDLMAVAAKIGGDVPVCVAARTSWVTGAGETVAPLAAPALHAVLVNPLAPVRTADVFHKFDEMGLGAGFAATSAPNWRFPDDVAEGAAAIGNDLIEPARRIQPKIAEVMTSLARPQAMFVSLSGSGATCFAVVASSDVASAFASELALLKPDWWVKAATLGLLDPPSSGS